ncbi:uncharacterized protein LOC131976775 [Centropristis striata]|uniref:uncharacterized protein LOC131976775 n=1 Tax=Centropristis striata TaxID=184440 RepID=UPI0027E0FE82|nr:uncharacterized protein LOC131976775 [Centropristis striata]
MELLLMELLLLQSCLSSPLTVSWFLASHVLLSWLLELCADMSLGINQSDQASTPLPSTPGSSTRPPLCHLLHSSTSTCLSSNLLYNEAERPPETLPSSLHPLHPPPLYPPPSLPSTPLPSTPVPPPVLLSATSSTAPPPPDSHLTSSTTNSSTRPPLCHLLHSSTSTCSSSNLLYSEAERPPETLPSSLHPLPSTPLPSTLSTLHPGSSTRPPLCHLLHSSTSTCSSSNLLYNEAERPPETLPSSLHPLPSTLYPPPSLPSTPGSSTPGSSTRPPLCHLLYSSTSTCLSSNLLYNEAERPPETPPPLYPPPLYPPPLYPPPLFLHPSSSLPPPPQPLEAQSSASTCSSSNHLHLHLHLPLI